MLAHTLHHDNGDSYCLTEYDLTAQWLRATWQGFVTAQDGEKGANAILKLLNFNHVPYLLNDNSQVTGPWFDSVEWLLRVWAPQAHRLGMRYVAHVVQPRTEADIEPYLEKQPFDGLFELQLFTTVAEASEWLHSCQQHDKLQARKPGAGGLATKQQPSRNQAA